MGTSALWGDLRHAVRRLRLTPGHTAVSVATLALGIGANAAMFSVVYGVLLRPLPYRQPEALVQLGAVREGASGPPANFSLTEFTDWETRSRGFDALAAVGFAPYSLAGGGGAQALRGAVVTGRFFSVLDAPFAAGRPLQPEDDSSPAVVISERLWRARFGADPSAVGASLVLNGQACTVVGVAPRGFAFPAEDVDVWVPAGYALTTAPGRWKMRGFRAFTIVGRLGSGVDAAAARQDAAAVAAWLAETYPRFNEHVGVAVSPLGERLTATARPALLRLFGAVGLVLLVACANLANLMLARGAARTREVAVRAALGATRGRLVSQFLVESAVLSALGAAAGLALAFWGVQAFVALHPADLPRIDSVRLDAPVLLFTAVLSIASVFLFGAVPALQASRARPATALHGARGASRSTRRLRGTLVVSELALSVMLLVGASLLARSLVALLETDLGVVDRRALTVKIDLPPGAVDQPARAAQGLARVAARVAALAGVRQAGFTSSLPPDVSAMHTSFAHRDEATGKEEEIGVEMVASSPDAFAALGVPLLRGRLFSAADTPEAGSVVVLSAGAARRFFKGGDAVGRRFPMSGSTARPTDPEVIGIVGDVKYGGLAAVPEGALYSPYTQRLFPSIYLIVRSSLDRLALSPAVRRAIAEEDPTLAVSAIRDLDGVVSDALAGPRLRAWLLGLMAGLALVLAGVGLYGVIAHSVTERTQEIGVRMALGARRGDVLRLVFAQGAALAAAGTVLGLGGAYALTRVLATFLYGVTPGDPWSFAMAPALLLLVTAVAIGVPARRATGVDPLVALRAD